MVMAECSQGERATGSKVMRHHYWEQQQKTRQSPAGASFKGEEGGFSAGFA